MTSEIHAADAIGGTEPRIYPASRMIAFTAIIVGVGWMLIATFLAVRLHISGQLRLQDSNGYIFTLVIAWSLMSIPGIACFNDGRRLYQRRSIARVRQAVGALTFASVIGMMLLNVSIFRTGLLPGNVSGVLVLVGVTSVVGFVIYAIVCRQVLLHDGFSTLGYSDILTRPFLWSLTLYVWLVIFMAGIAKLTNSSYAIPTSIAGMFGWAVGAFAVSWCLYQGLCWAVGHKGRAMKRHFENTTEN